MIEGGGSPASKEYQHAVEALFAVSYSLKFMVKKRTQAIDYGVLPLEGIWWSENMETFNSENKEAWKWTSMIMQPELVTEAMVKEAIDQVKKKKNPPSLSKIRFQPFEEGLSAQIMHLGPYSAEKTTVEKLWQFNKKEGFEFNGKHHEIYLVGPIRSSPEKMKTILRQPIKKN